MTLILKIFYYNYKEYNKYMNIIMKKYIKQYKESEVLTNIIGIYPELESFYVENNLFKYVDFSKLSDNLKKYFILK